MIEIAKPNNTFIKSFQTIGNKSLNTIFLLVAYNQNSLHARSQTKTHVVDIGILLYSLKYNNINA
ncbi:MAG: hypothetical protein Q8S84_01835 [bacterium]|nr:hypothetical protein [bacterium]MDP3380300.1 hypothetical protein [bacterium]